MLSGDNGLLKRAGDARDDTVVGQEKEQVELAYISAAVKKIGDVVDEEALRIELNSSVGDGKTTVSTNVDDTLNVYFSDTQHNYNVNNGKVSKQTPPSEDYFALREGDTVYYKDSSNNDIECTVLYDSTNANYSTYGVQIISRNPVTTQELGNGTGTSQTNNTTYFNIAKDSYNNAINILNTAAENYVSSNSNLVDIAKSSRCVGSLPDNNNARNTEKYSNSYSYFSSYNNQFEASESDSTYKENNTDNYTVDWAQLNILGIHTITDKTIDNYYWLASRWAGGSTFNGAGVAVRTVYFNTPTQANYTYLFYVNYDRSSTSYSVTHGIRPVITLKSNIKITETDGKKYLSVE